MTYLELVKEWDSDMRTKDPRFRVSIFKGENWDSYTVEERAKQFVNLLTSEGVEISTEDM